MTRELKSQLKINVYNLRVIVQSFGTEDRPLASPKQMSDQIHEFVVFGASNIESVEVIEPPLELQPSNGNEGTSKENKADEILQEFCLE